MTQRGKRNSRLAVAVEVWEANGESGEEYVTGDLRPYRLRGSFVSLLLWSGEDLAYVAEQAGHSIATLARHYSGTMRELQGQPRVPAEQAIRQAREEASGQLRLVEER